MMMKPINVALLGIGTVGYGTWTGRASGTGGTINGICYGDGYFIAVGAAGYLATSPDGITWTPRTSGTGLELQRVAYGNGSFVVTGNGGIILQSASTFPALINQKVGGNMEVNLVGGFDRTYVLETASDVDSLSWTPLTTLTPGQRQFSDPDAAASRKFYRLTLP